MENRKLELEAASEILYNSQLYQTLEDEETKLWRLGYPLLYDLLDEELATGKITFPEEQILRFKNRMAEYGFYRLALNCINTKKNKRKGSF